jgi:phosphopantothenoylcysteine decarboxylase
VAILQEGGWDVCAVVTPAALAWADTAALRKVTGHPVRSKFRAPDEPEFDPRGDAVLVAPATFNTINKCASGLSDGLALGLMNEALGTESIPLVIVPWVNATLANHPAYEPSLALLRAAGARVISPEASRPEAFEGALLAAARWITTTSRAGRSA